MSLIDEARLEAYKTWRVNTHQIRDITLRHDLHALSRFFCYAIKQRWTRENPIRKVEIPSDADASACTSLPRPRRNNTSVGQRGIKIYTIWAD